LWSSPALRRRSDITTTVLYASARCRGHVGLRRSQRSTAQNALKICAGRTRSCRASRRLPGWRDWTVRQDNGRNRGGALTRSERATQIWPILTLCASRRQTLTYDLLGRLIGVPRQGLGQLLEPIQSYCI